MHDHLVFHLLPSWEDWIFESSWAFQEMATGTLGIAWKSKKEWEAQLPPQLRVVFIDCKEGKVKHLDTYEWHGLSMENIRLWVGIQPDEWFITWRSLNPTNILLCPIHWNIPLVSVTPVAIDEVKRNMTHLGTVVFVATTERDVRVVRLQPLIDNTEPSLVRLSRMVEKYPGNLEHIGFMKPILETILSGGISQAKGIWEALKAGAVSKGQGWYLVTFNAQYNMNEEFVIEHPNIGIRNVVKGRPYWSMAVSGGPLPVSKQTWKHSFNMQIQASSNPYSRFTTDVIVGAYLIAGPDWMSPQKGTLQTVIIAVGLIKKEALGLPEEQAHSLRGGELICLSQNGQVVQECKEEIVEQVELCLVGNTVIGVDRIQRRWRLWQWEPLAGKEQFTTVQWLDESVVHAHVVTNHENSDPQGTQFWLVEERPKGLAVSRRDGQTLKEIEEPITLTGWSLPYALDRPVGEWDWPIKKGLIGHEDALLLIAADEENRMVLYRVEADKQ